MEAGEESMALAGDNLLLEDRAQTVVLQAWDDHRNLVRRITAIESESRGRLELRFERFAKKTGTLTLLDLNRGGRQAAEESSLEP